MFLLNYQFIDSLPSNSGTSYPVYYRFMSFASSALKQLTFSVHLVVENTGNNLLFLFHKMGIFALSTFFLSLANNNFLSVSSITSLKPANPFGIL